MKRLLVVCIVAATVVACSKDKFKTEPQAEIKSITPAEVTKGQFFTMRAIIRDKEGDIQDSVLIVRKRYNGDVLLGKADTLRYSIKEFGFPQKTELEITAVFSYGEIRDGYIFQNLENADRNLTVGIIVRDKAGNKSPYVESEKIVLKKL